MWRCATIVASEAITIRNLEVASVRRSAFFRVTQSFRTLTLGLPLQSIPSPFQFSLALELPIQLCILILVTTLPYPTVAQVPQRNPLLTQ
jgi:hypothetical protein